LRLRSMAVPKRENEKAKQNGGEAKKEVKEKAQEKIVVKEETEDVTMVDAQTEAVKTEDAPAKDDAVVHVESEQQPEKKEEEVKQEPEVEPELEVGVTDARVAKAILTFHSSQKKIATYSTIYSVKTPRMR
jgi:hypothetical protein